MASTPNFETLSRPFIHPGDMPDLHALHGYGTCMEPLIADGALLVIDKREEPRPGDVVSLIFTQEAARQWRLPGLVKKLAFALPPRELPREMGAVVVDQINPPRRYVIPLSDLLAVFKCVGTATSNADGTARYHPQTGKIDATGSVSREHGKVTTRAPRRKSDL